MLITDNKLHLPPNRQRNLGWIPITDSKPQSHTLPPIICKTGIAVNRTTSFKRVSLDPLAALSTFLWLPRRTNRPGGRHSAKRGLYSQTKQPCNLVSHFKQVSDKPRISPDYCDSIVPHILQLISPSHTHTKKKQPTSLRHMRHGFPSSLQDLAQGVSGPLSLANKAAVCLISDCCHGYSKQGERGVCVYEQTHLLAGAI